MGEGPFRIIAFRSSQMAPASPQPNGSRSQALITHHGTARSSRVSHTLLLQDGNQARKWPAVMPAARGGQGFAPRSPVPCAYGGTVLYSIYLSMSPPSVGVSTSVHGLWRIHSPRPSPLLTWFESCSLPERCHYSGSTHPVSGNLQPWPVRKGQSQLLRRRGASQQTLHHLS